MTSIDSVNAAQRDLQSGQCPDPALLSWLLPFRDSQNSQKLIQILPLLSANTVSGFSRSRAVTRQRRRKLADC